MIIPEYRVGVQHNITMTYCTVFACGFSGVDLTADSLMDRLDNGVLLCQLAQLLQEKMIHTNNGKVLQQEEFQKGFILFWPVQIKMRMSVFL